jgi:hypothetical protein
MNDVVLHPLVFHPPSLHMEHNTFLLSVPSLKEAAAAMAGAEITWRDPSRHKLEGNTVRKKSHQYHQ